MTLDQDKKLVSRCLAGDEDAWTRLYKRTYHSIRFIAFWNKWHFPRDKAEEIMQDVFTGLVSSLKNFNFDCSLETFAGNITKNKCISEVRRINAAKREGEKQTLSLDDIDAQGNPRLVLEDKESKSLFEERLENEETAVLLKSTLDNMGQSCRHIIKLKYFENLSYEEIVSILNLPLGTVSSRLQRCLLELRNLCEKIRGDLL